MAGQADIQKWLVELPECVPDPPEDQNGEQEAPFSSKDSLHYGKAVHEESSQETMSSGKLRGSSLVKEESNTSIDSQPEPPRKRQKAAPPDLFADSAPIGSSTPLRSRPVSNKCGNPGCAGTVENDRYIRYHGNTYRVCDSCYALNADYAIPGPREAIKKMDEQKRRIVQDGTKCSQCGVMVLCGVYHDYWGNFYCEDCGQFRRSMRGSAVSRKKCGMCDNPNCTSIRVYMLPVKIRGMGTFEFCTHCRDYAMVFKKMRPSDVINRYNVIGCNEMVPEKCYNCHTTDIHSGGYALNCRFACYACREYYNEHGKDKPEYMMLKKCENPNCGVLREIVKKRDNLNLCKMCYSYTRIHKGEMRPRKAVLVSENVKRLKESLGKFCHNPDCGLRLVSPGCFSKRNGMLYCDLCAKYMDSHGTERTRMLIDGWMSRRKDYEKERLLSTRVRQP